LTLVLLFNLTGQTNTNVSCRVLYVNVVESLLKRRSSLPCVTKELARVDAYVGVYYFAASRTPNQTPQDGRIRCKPVRPMTAGCHRTLFWCY